MTMPATRPVMTENESPTQFSTPSRQRMPNVAAAISSELKLTPTPSERSSSRIVAPSFVRTRKMPRIESRMPTAAISIGAITALICNASEPAEEKAAAPSAAVARIEPQ